MYLFPASDVNDVCFSSVVKGVRGYVSSPFYPQRYPPSLDCRTQVVAPRGYRIRLYQLDLYLAYFSINANKK